MHRTSVSEMERPKYLRGMYSKHEQRIRTTSARRLHERALPRPPMTIRHPSPWLRRSLGRGKAA